MSDNQFDQKKGVEIQGKSLNQVKKLIKKIEDDLNAVELDRYHSAAISIEVLSRYLGKEERFLQECKDMYAEIRNYFLSQKETA